MKATNFLGSLLHHNRSWQQNPLNIILCVQNKTCASVFIEALIYAGRDWGQEEKETTEDEMAGWHR